MFLGALSFIGYGLVFLFRSMFGSGFELGVHTLNGTTVAELSALAFFDISGRTLPIRFEQDRLSPQGSAVYGFYCERGKDYCLDLIQFLVTLPFSVKPYRDLKVIEEKVRFYD